ncbi:MAG: alpha/beta hydrolase [Promethearchaeota archaeon]|nr:MAG: alpha/beta hydrolase [Candidatus Lokiarchaeota archaeon]
MEIFNEINELNVKINNLTLHVMIIGEGKPLILLHGFPDFWYGWKSVIPELKDKFKLIIPDMRGYNLSDKPEGTQNYKINHLIDDIKGLIEFFDLKKPFIAGHDWGGIVAWVFAEKYPDIVQKLIILNSPHPKIFNRLLKTNKAQQKASSYIFQFHKSGGEQFLFKNDYKWLKSALFGSLIDKKALDDFDMEQYINAWSQPNALISGVNYYKANPNFDDFSGVIKVPTLVIHGMNDLALLPVILEGLENFVENVTIIKVPNSSHWVLHEQPHLVSTKIINFLED